MKRKIEEIINMDIETLEKMSDRELEELLRPFIPKVRKPDVDSPARQEMISSMITQLQNLMNK